MKITEEQRVYLEKNCTLGKHNTCGEFSACPRCGWWKDEIRRRKRMKLYLCADGKYRMILKNRCIVMKKGD